MLVARYREMRAGRRDSPRSRSSTNKVLRARSDLLVVLGDALERGRVVLARDVAVLIVSPQHARALALLEAVEALVRKLELAAAVKQRWR